MSTALCLVASAGLGYIRGVGADRDMAGPGWWARGAGAAVAGGAALAFLGPFGTYGDFTPVERWTYWIVLTVLMWAQTAAAFHVLRLVSGVRRRPWFVQAGLAALAGAVPTTFEVAYAEGLLRVGGVLTPASLVETYGYVAVIALGLFVPLVWLDRPRPAAASEPSRLPPELRGPVLALSAEDHYLRVHTRGGDSLIHHRFSHAVRELGGAGVQVHRSWWVAKDAVRGVERDGERLVLVLDRGLRVPVSRTYALAAREAGLLPARD